MSNLIQCIYASAAIDEIGQRDLANILEEARERNTAKDITGMLVFHEGAFLQVLEGPAAAVETLVKAIKRDPRHGAFRLLLADTIEDREFEEWSMGFVDTSGVARDLPGFVDYRFELDAAIRNKNEAKKVLERFRDGMLRQSMAA